MPEQDKSRRERFLRVAQRRTREILHKIHLLGNCSNRSAYEFTDEEVGKIFDAIEEELRVAQSRFGRKKSVDFHL